MKVLIVDDDQALLSVMVAILSNCGHTVLRAFTDQSARQIFSADEGIARVIMDGRLDPHSTQMGPDTLELIKWMRSERPSVRIIANSANDEYEGKMVSAGCEYKAGKNLGVLAQLLSS